jgi:uncharacterized protein (TIGR01777 family)
MAKKVIITGATGSIGKNLTQKLIARGDEVTIFSNSIEKARNILPGAYKYVKWSAYEKGEWGNELNGKDAVIHLAGQSLFGALWDDDYKQKILKSREIGTRNLVSEIINSGDPPKIFISASAIGYYGGSKLTTFTEESPSGSGFLADVCMRWEKESYVIEENENSIRRVVVRVGIVLDKDEGILNWLQKFYNFYLGGTVGDGLQWISWVHLSDTANIFIYALDHENVSGIINAVAPNPVTMKQLTSSLEQISGKPNWIKIPAFPIEAAIGDASVPVTQGIKVYPRRTLDLGYKFEHPDFEEAIKDIL